MIITDAFECGNIRVISQTPERVCIDQDCHNGDPGYFYWAFRVIRDHADKPGRVRFEFPAHTRRMGDCGAAKSYDLIHWKWTGKTEDNGFFYDFTEADRELTFAFCCVYTPARLNAFFTESGILPDVFTTSRKGRAVPCFTIGDGEKLIVFTSRHHACESPGTFVMEGIARACRRHPLPGYRFLFVPFVDYDGVLDGDAGKNRLPHDHNRDYGEEASIYPETARLREIAALHPTAAFDLHAPYISGNEHDTAYFLRGPENRYETAFRQTLRQLTAADPDCFDYTGAWDFTYGAEWNEPHKPNMRNYFLKESQNHFALTLETSYFGTPDNRFTESRVTRFGEKFYEALASVLDANAL
ncbi:MAG: hypothetical protein IJF67_05195 [Clostridia bacterium]|nr:hypothetical protein [Clostridia bacterium]